MKRVDKGRSPEPFEEWKGKANDDWQPAYAELRNPEKHLLHQTLLKEQGWVCCYCGRTVSLEDSHIEHFRPQHAYQALELSYDNLHASCLRAAKPGQPLHCGHAKADKFDEGMHISPLDPACEHRFMYTSHGQVLSSRRGDEGATYMAALLALDTPVLRHARAEALSRTLDAAFLESATVEELGQLRDAFRARNEDGKLIGFGHVVARYAEQWLVGTTDDLPEQGRHT